MTDIARKKKISPLVWIGLVLLVLWAAVWANQRGLFRTPAPDNLAAATYGSNPAPKNENPNNLP